MEVKSTQRAAHLTGHNTAIKYKCASLRQVYNQTYIDFSVIATHAKQMSKQTHKNVYICNYILTAIHTPMQTLS